MLCEYVRGGAGPVQAGPARVPLLRQDAVRLRHGGGCPALAAACSGGAADTVHLSKGMPPAAKLLRGSVAWRGWPRPEVAGREGVAGLERLVDDSLDGCEPWAAPLRVAVLLSGGVDSSLALRQVLSTSTLISSRLDRAPAHTPLYSTSAVLYGTCLPPCRLLQRAGHHVRAFYLQIWFQEDFRNSWDACPWQDDVQTCQLVCSQLGVDLEVVPLTQEYWQRVVSASMAEIRAGRTPNPDILCNSHVKFGAFVEFLDAQCPGQYDRIASGHYARLLRQSRPGEPVQLAMTKDPVKDQTYFLARLRQTQLSRLLFPLAPLIKADVRRLAAAERLPNQARPDSQGICFLGKVQFTEFVREHLGDWPGPMVEEESGLVVGFHDGYWFYTLGQRKGIQLAGGPWFVCRKDVRNNAVYVSKQYHDPAKQRNAFRCDSFNWVAGSPPDLQQTLHCKVRHGPTLYECSMTISQDGAFADVVLNADDQGLAPGQSAVFYQQGLCCGSGIIQHALLY